MKNPTPRVLAGIVMACGAFGVQAGDGGERDPGANFNLRVPYQRDVVQAYDK